MAVIAGRNARAPVDPGQGRLHPRRPGQAAAAPGRGLVEPLDQQQLAGAARVRLGQLGLRRRARRRERGRRGRAAAEAGERLARAYAVVRVLVALHRLRQKQLARAVGLAQGEPRPGRPVEEPRGGAARGAEAGRRLERLRGRLVAAGAIVGPARAPRGPLDVTALSGYSASRRRHQGAAPSSSASFW